MPQVDLSGFRTVAFDYGKIHVRGGALAKASPVISKAIVLTENRTITFVKMSSREQWLIAAVTGEKKTFRCVRSHEFVRRLEVEDCSIL